MIFYNEKTPFPAIRKICSKSRKIDIFQKGLTHRLGPKMAIFPSFFFGNIAQENVPYDILQRKNAFQGYKKKKYKKVQKLTFFQSHGFGPKITIFPPFFSRQYRPGKCLLRYSRTKKNAFLGQKQEVQKVKKLTFFQRG